MMMVEEKGGIIPVYGVGRWWWGPLYHYLFALKVGVKYRIDRTARE